MTLHSLSFFVCSHSFLFTIWSHFSTFAILSFASLELNVAASTICQAKCLSATEKIETEGILQRR